MTRFTRTAAAVCLLGALATSGCLNLSVGTNPEGSGVKFDGLLNGFIEADGLGAYDGDILKAGLFSHADGDDLASIDIWPIGGVGVGLVGAHVRVLPLEFGFGTLFHDPVPFRSGKRADDEELHEQTEDGHDHEDHGEGDHE